MRAPSTEPRGRTGKTPRTFYRHAPLLAAIFLLVFTSSCTSKPDADTLVMIIESAPQNLDPRVGTDAQSERIGALLFDALLERDQHFQVQPHLAVSWEIPDPLTYVFHLRRGVRFHDGRALTSRDVKWTFDSVRDGTLRTPKASTYRWIERIETPDDATVVFHLREPYAPLLWNLSGGAIGVVPYGSGPELKTKPVGSGPFRFVSLAQDKDVVIERNDDYWGEKPRVKQVRFAVVPDTTTRVLELEKGSADVAINALTADMVEALRSEGRLRITEGPGTIYAYIALNLEDPVLKDVRVRRALGYAIDRRPILHYLWRDLARPAESLLPPEHWAFSAEGAKYDYDPERARRLLDEAGYPASSNGVRLRLTMKTSTEESTRLLAAVLQQQLRAVGVELEIRSYEFATFFSDVTRGAFQVISLRWIGGNEDPDIFEHVFHSASFPPKRANRGHYASPRVDALIDEARRTPDSETRRRLYAEVQRRIAEDVPYIHLWYLDNVLVHSPRVKGAQVASSGNYDFLKTVELE